jgi:hypothetical protein
MPKNVYQKYGVKVPDREVGITHDIKGRQNPTMTYLSDKLVPRSNTYIEIGVPHGPLVWKKVDRPHIEMVIMPGAGTVEESNPAGYLKPEDTKK